MSSTTITVTIGSSGQVMFLAPTPVLQFFDANGDPLAGGQLFTYAAGTTTKQNTYTDNTGNTPLPNPIVLNARGEIAPSATSTSCGCWLDPTLGYKFVLSPATDTDPPTNPIWTVDGIVSPNAGVLAALAQYEASIAGVPIGSQISYAGVIPPSGWLFCDGSAVNRSIYSALFAVIGTGYGSGDGSTTFNIPDKRGRASIGADNMNGVAANRVTFAVSGINSTVIGSGGGDQNSQLHNHTVTDPGHGTTLNDPGHIHQQFYTGSFPGHGVPEGGVTNAVGPGTQSPDMATASATTGITADTAFTGITIANYGTGAAQNMPPVQVDNVIIYTGVA